METTLRQFGNSIGLVIPKPLRDTLHLIAGQLVTLEQKDDILTIRPSHTIKYSLDELLSQCDLNAPEAKTDIAWNMMPAVGKEIW